jgi:hypothetical protein
MNIIPVNELLAAALVGYQAKLRALDDKIRELRSEIGGTGKVAVISDGATPVLTTRRSMSASGKARVAAAQKKRWAAFHKDKAPKVPEKTAPKKKRKLSAAGRKAIAEATKKRWAAHRTAKAKAASKTPGGAD